WPGFGGMVSFLPSPKGSASGADRAITVAEGTRLFTLAESLGGVESLIEVPAAMTHMSVSETALAVDPALIRLSVGIEGADDLIADLRQALDSA
ncbi:MAG TPA: PLP-dependent transferase, partial [Mycobacteriales bacterium]|nr:PLP-dependent transferase [Mycobacteriales bacterium]